MRLESLSQTPSPPQLDFHSPQLSSHTPNQPSKYSQLVQGIRAKHCLYFIVDNTPPNKNIVLIFLNLLDDSIYFVSPTESANWWVCFLPCQSRDHPHFWHPKITYYCIHKSNRILQRSCPVPTRRVQTP